MHNAQAQVVDAFMYAYMHACMIVCARVRCGAMFVALACRAGVLHLPARVQTIHFSNCLLNIIEGSICLRAHAHAVPCFWLNCEQAAMGSHVPSLMSEQLISGHELQGRPLLSLGGRPW